MPQIMVQEIPYNLGQVNQDIIYDFPTGRWQKNAVYGSNLGT